MARNAILVFALSSLLIAAAYACGPSTPKPLDTSSYPSASTSAEPLYISNAPSARPEPGARKKSSAAPPPSASVLVAPMSSAPEPKTP